MKVTLDLNNLDDYRTFLKVKGLPRYSFTGREAEFPDEYAKHVGVKASRRRNQSPYVPVVGLFDYQAAVAALAIQKRKFAVFMEPGMGKTLIDFEFAHHAMKATDLRCLIVAPLMVVRQMIAEHGRFYPGVEGPEQVRAAGLQGWLSGEGPAFGITNYEAIREGLTPGNLGVLILSESSMLKSHYGKWGQRLIQLGKGLHWKLCETGTPAPNDRIEYANHAVFLDQYPTTNAFLARFFVNRGQTDNRWELKPHALHPFYRAMSHWSIFVTNPAVYGWKDNVESLPAVNVHIDDVELTAAQSEAATLESGSLFSTAGGITSRAKLAQIAKGNHNGEKIDTLKPAYMKSLVDSWPGESTIIWCRFNREQEELASLFPSAANISGDTPEDERIRLIAEFQAGRVKVLLSKARILGFGLNLHICTRMIFSSLQDSYEEYFQAVKRANRYGSTRPLEVYIPITEIERPMVETVLRKARMVAADTREQERIFKESSFVA